MAKALLALALGVVNGVTAATLRGSHWITLNQIEEARVDALLKVVHNSGHFSEKTRLRAAEIALKAAHVDEPIESTVSSVPSAQHPPAARETLNSAWRRRHLRHHRHRLPHDFTGGMTLKKSESDKENNRENQNIKMKLKTPLEWQPHGTGVPLLAKRRLALMGNSGNIEKRPRVELLNLNGQLIYPEL